MALQVTGGLNTQIKNLEASGRLIVEYARDINRFNVNKYTAVKNTTKSTGLYLDISPDMAARIQLDLVNDYYWAPAANRPTNNVLGTEHEFKPFITKRYDYDKSLDWKAIEEGEWDVSGSLTKALAAKAMSGRSVLAATTATTVANWGANTALATALNAGAAQLDAGTADNPVLRESLNTVVQAIRQATDGVVTRDMLVLTASPTTWETIAEGDEISQLVRQSLLAINFIEGKERFNESGLPKNLYGFADVISEDCIRVTSAPGATRVDQEILDDNVIVSLKPGALDFDTITGFFKEEMTVEENSDPRNRRTDYSVVEDFVYHITASASGYLIRDAV